MTSLQAFKTEIERLDREATAGPWHNDGHNLFQFNDGTMIADLYDIDGELQGETQNGNFIAYARTALPALLALAEALEKERDQWGRELGEAKQAIVTLERFTASDEITIRAQAARLTVAEDESSSAYRQLGELTRLCNVLTNELPPTVLSTEGEIARKAIRSYIESVGVPTAALAE